jgi:hypothetical protein
VQGARTTARERRIERAARRSEAPLETCRSRTLPSSANSQRSCASSRAARGRPISDRKRRTNTRSLRRATRVWCKSCGGCAPGSAATLCSNCARPSATAACAASRALLRGASSIFRALRGSRFIRSYLHLYPEG